MTDQTLCWAKTNPSDLESKWGCGTISIEDKTKRDENEI